MFSINGDVRKMLLGSFNPDMDESTKIRLPYEDSHGSPTPTKRRTRRSVLSGSLSEVRLQGNMRNSDGSPLSRIRTPTKNSSDLDGPFTIIGPVEKAEIQYEANSRSKDRSLGPGHVRYTNQGSNHGFTLWNAATGEQPHRPESHSGDIVAVTSPDGKQLASTSMDQAISWDKDGSTLAKVMPSETKKWPHNLNDTENIGKVQFSHDAGKSMTQVRNALSYVGGGQHTVHIHVDWQLGEFVRDGLDNPQDLVTALTITGEPDEAYACSCEDYVKFAWRENTSIAAFFHDFATSEFISSSKPRKYHRFRQRTLNVACITDYF